MILWNVFQRVHEKVCGRILVEVSQRCFRRFFSELPESIFEWFTKIISREIFEEKPRVIREWIPGGISEYIFKGFSRIFFGNIPKGNIPGMSQHHRYFWRCKKSHRLLNSLNNTYLYWTHVLETFFLNFRSVSPILFWKFI